MGWTDAKPYPAEGPGKLVKSVCKCLVPCTFKQEGTDRQVAEALRSLAYSPRAIDEATDMLCDYIVGKKSKGRSESNIMRRLEEIQSSVSGSPSVPFSSLRPRELT
jgi:hypothetical protein